MIGEWPTNSDWATALQLGNPSFNQGVVEARWLVNAPSTVSYCLLVHGC